MQHNNQIVGITTYCCCERLLLECVLSASTVRSWPKAPKMIPETCRSARPTQKDRSCTHTGQSRTSGFGRRIQGADVAMLARISATLSPGWPGSCCGSGSSCTCATRATRKPPAKVSVAHVMRS